MKVARNRSANIRRASVAASKREATRIRILAHRILGELGAPLFAALKQLVGEPKTIQDLEEQGIPFIRHHVLLLKTYGLVNLTKRGPEFLYVLSSLGVDVVLQAAVFQWLALVPVAPE